MTSRRSAAFGMALLPAALSSCGSTTVVEVIDSGTMPFPVIPALIVPDVVLPSTQPDREPQSALAAAALNRGIGERPLAVPGPDVSLVAQALARGLPRVVLLTVVQARVLRSGLFWRPVADAAIRMRVIDARTGWSVGDATFLRRTRGTNDIADEVATLAASLLA